MPVTSCVVLQDPAGRQAFNAAACADLPGAKGKAGAAVPALFAALQACKWPTAQPGLCTEDLRVCCAVQ